MNKKMSKRQKDIKSKLMAAICMLLVSSIMMVSSTYAWFTLSTAPEVTGIQTAVGANGNLEMALIPTDGISSTGAAKDADYGVTSKVGDSVLDDVARNVTWGNLVDLSDTTVYGMDKITLYPSALNISTEDDAKNPLALKTDAFLMTPTYGADGRVDELAANTVTSTYISSDSSFPQNDFYGVRAVGTASGMTQRQLDYRSARAAANTAMTQATIFAAQSLNVNGASLANIAVAHAMNSAATHTQADVASLTAIITDLLGDGDTTGVIEYIEEAYIQYIYALAASNASTEEAYLAVKTDVEADMSLDDLVAKYGSVSADLVTYVGYLNSTRDTVEEALVELNKLTGDSIAWSEISVPLFMLAETNALKVNGYEVSGIKEHMGDLIASASSGINVTMATGGGVYADIADHCGDYNASIVLKDLEAGGVKVDKLDAKMATASTVKPSYVSRIGTAVQTEGAPSSTGTVMPITDMYGYIIDLAFKTNAAESNLLLQADAVDRIYTDNKAGVEVEGETTMGHGSSMTFTATAAGFNSDSMKELMKAINIVFFNPTSLDVLATAKLDVDTATVVGGNEVTAKMYLYELSNGGTTYEYIEAKYVASGDTYVEAGADDTATHAKDGEDYVLATLYKDGEEWKAADADHPATHYQKATTTKAGENKLTGTDAVITSLTQNQAQAVSVLVYLNGYEVTNADVAATGSSSMTGTMNLQFASSATLTPMNYTPLMEQGGTATGGENAEGGGDAQG